MPGRTRSSEGVAAVLLHVGREHEGKFVGDRDRSFAGLCFERLGRVLDRRLDNGAHEIDVGDPQRGSLCHIGKSGLMLLNPALRKRQIPPPIFDDPRSSCADGWPLWR